MPLIETKGAASSQGFGQFARTTAATYIEDVFSTYLYTGSFSATNIVNGIDLSSKGGLVWTKSRNLAYSNNLVDTARGSSAIFSDLTNAQASGYTWTANSNGYTLSTSDNTWNNPYNNYVSWTFRKQPKFFDVVTYTGNGANRTIAHNLGSVPGCIIVKRTDTTGDWQVYHRSLANTEYMVLNSTAAKATGTTRWNSTTPTTSVFSLGTDATVNASGGTYVAYLFAHDAGGFGLSGTDNVISCGSLVSPSTGGSTTVTLGWEPQFLLMKSTSAGDNWDLVDVMRGMSYSTTSNLSPSTSDAESNFGTGYFLPTPTGFVMQSGWRNDRTIVYIAIRRGPMKVPTSGTSVFAPVTQILATGSVVTTGFVTDMGLSKALSAADPIMESRLTNRYLRTNTTGAESSGSSTWGYMNGYGPTPWSGSGLSSVAYGFRRAPGFFDVVCYTGTGSTSQTVNHNLGVEPELIILKCRNVTNDGGATNGSIWNVAVKNGSTAIHFAIVGSQGLNFSGASTWSEPWVDIYATSASFMPYRITGAFTTTPAGATSGNTYVAYLFASCPGVSKVGSYTGTGTTQQINCGFTGGARFVLIKRTDGYGGDWYVWDSARGIVAGNDPYLLLNSTAAEVTNTDYIDTLSTGFEISSTAPAAINGNGGTFIYLAIA